MTNKIRDEYLKALGEEQKSSRKPQESSELLLNMLDEVERLAPGLLQDFSDEPGEPSLDDNQLSWTADYFYRHMGAVSYNFSRKRIEHLIRVLEYCREKGFKGFVPTPPPSIIDTKSESGMTKNYTPSTHLQKFVAEGDLLTIRTALRMELNDNRQSSADLRAALAWVKAEVPGLFELNQEKAFARGCESEQKLWNSQYYDSQIVYLKNNFSEERLLHLIEVRECLRQQGVEGFAAVAPKQQPKQGGYAGGSAQSQAGQLHQAGTVHDNPDRNPVFAAAIMVGGALAVLVVLLIALVK